MSIRPGTVIIRYDEERTALGLWRRYDHPSGGHFQEFRSHHGLGDIPWLHYTSGICPETGGRVVARGVVAVGRIAVGLVAIGQLAVGVIAVGQFALGLMLVLGQAALGAVAIGQLAVAYGAVGQLAVGYLAVGQYGIGEYALAQMGYAEHLWSQHAADPEAVRFFRELAARWGRF